MVSVNFEIQKYYDSDKMYAYITLKNNSRLFGFSCNPEEMRNLVLRFQEIYQELIANMD